jgi:hypothetical protein
LAPQAAALQLYDLLLRRVVFLLRQHSRLNQILQLPETKALEFPRRLLGWLRHHVERKAQGVYPVVRNVSRSVARIVIRDTTEDLLESRVSLVARRHKRFTGLDTSVAVDLGDEPLFISFFELKTLQVSHASSVRSLLTLSADELLAGGTFEEKLIH